MTIFYSWQSDIDGKINRSFIHAALKEAVKKLNATGSFNIIIDHATRNVPGTADIPTSILKKIDDCSIFVADITLINAKDVKRRTPNPNVLIELGYAIKKHGFEKIITIFNSEFGEYQELPFDIKHRRPMEYKYNKNMERITILKLLSKDIENAILLIDKMTMTKDKIDFIFYNKTDGKYLGKNLIINDTIFKSLKEDDFFKGIDFTMLMEIKNNKKLSEWQEYLFDETKKNIERKDALQRIRGMAIIHDVMIVDQFETKDYYKIFMYCSLLRTNSCKFDLLIKNNNEQTMKNLKIVLKTKKINKILREADFPELPARSTFSTMAFGGLPGIKKSLFLKKEYGDFIIFEYEKENLYASEEYVLDEPLFVILHEHSMVEIEYTIYLNPYRKLRNSL